MNVTINSQLLAQELRLLKKVVPSKPTLPILGYARFDADASGLRMAATDLEVGLMTSLDAAKTHETGALMLPIDKLYELINCFEDGDVSIHEMGAAVQVSCGSFRSKLQTMNVNDFPQLPEVQGSEHGFDSVQLREMVNRTSYAISHTTQKYVLRAALLEVQQLTGGRTGCRMVAVDGKRLAMATANCTGPDVRVLLPSKMLEVLPDVPDDGNIIMRAGTNHLFFVFGRRLLFTRMMEGEFPKYERIIPKDADVNVLVDRAALAAALRRMLVIAETNRAVYLTFDKSSIELKADSSESGSAVEQLLAGYDGSPERICINGDYLLNFLEAAASSSITILMKHGGKAARLHDSSDQHFDHLGVIMLMNDGKKSA